MKTIPNITKKQIAERGVQSLSDRPNTAAKYGVSGLSPTQLKLWFDKLSIFLADKINEIHDCISSEEAAEYIRIALDEYQITSLNALIASMLDGNLASKVLKAIPFDGEDLKPLQTIINDSATNQASLKNQIDSLNSALSILEQAFSEHSQTSGSHFENLYGAIGNLQTVDSQLSSAIAAEQSARVQADNVHNQQIISLNEAVAAHNTHIINLITSIQDLSKVDGTLNTAIIDETTTRQKADEAMDERIKTLEDTINGFINVSEDGA